jgi:DNA-binding beta-propeller fold protein YncE
VGAIRSGRDLGRKIGWFEQLKSAVFGPEPMEMVKPTAVAKNEAGLLAVTDTSVPTVHLFDLEQREYWRLDDDLASLLRSPVGVAVDRAGNVYVADSVQGRVFVFAEGKRLAAEVGMDVLHSAAASSCSASMDGRSGSSGTAGRARVSSTPPPTWWSVVRVGSASPTL